MKLKFKNPFPSRFGFGPIGNFFVRIYQALSRFFRSRKTLRFVSVFLLPFFVQVVVWVADQSLPFRIS